jgi:hypothetical protein
MHTHGTPICERSTYLCALTHSSGGPCFSGIGACSGDTLLPVLGHLLTHIKAGSEINILTSAKAALEDDSDLDLAEWIGFNGEGGGWTRQLACAP